MSKKLPITSVLFAGRVGKRDDRPVIWRTAFYAPRAMIKHIHFDFWILRLYKTIYKIRHSVDLFFVTFEIIFDLCEAIFERFVGRGRSVGLRGWRSLGRWFFGFSLHFSKKFGMTLDEIVVFEFQLARLALSGCRKLKRKITKWARSEIHEIRDLFQKFFQFFF